MNEHLLKTFRDAASAIHLTLEERDLELFSRYYRELMRWNEKINLISARRPEEILVKHFIDSLTPLPYITHPTGRLLDIGAGAGFPGIPLKIVMPTLQVFLLEASRKKSSFLRHMIRQLSLAQTAVINARTESAMTDDAHHHAFDTVISRAAFKLPELFTLGRFFLSPGGVLIAMKGPFCEAGKGIPSDFGLRFTASHHIHLPLGGGQRNILIYQQDR
jgi:16S rRNA (guanine527-N7)-methyltransferase